VEIEPRLLAWYEHLLLPSELLNNRNYIFYMLCAGIFNLYNINSFSLTTFTKCLILITCKSSALAFRLTIVFYSHQRIQNDITACVHWIVYILTWLTWVGHVLNRTPVALNSRCWPIKILSIFVCLSNYSYKARKTHTHDNTLNGGGLLSLEPYLVFITVGLTEVDHGMQQQINVIRPYLFYSNHKCM